MRKWQSIRIAALLWLTLVVPAQAQNLTAWWNASDPRGSFARLVEGRPPNSENLIALSPYLVAICGRLENANAAGIVAKIVLPTGDIIRVGNHFDSDPTLFQKDWVWVPQDGHYAMPPCVPTPGPAPPGPSPSPQPVPTPVPSVDVTQVLVEIRELRATSLNEFADIRRRVDDPGWFTKVVKHPIFVGIASAVGTWVTNKLVTKP